MGYILLIITSLCLCCSEQSLVLPHTKKSASYIPGIANRTVIFFKPEPFTGVITPQITAHSHYRATKTSLEKAIENNLKKINLTKMQSTDLRSEHAIPLKINIQNLIINKKGNSLLPENLTLKTIELDTHGNLKGKVNKKHLNKICKYAFKGLVLLNPQAPSFIIELITPKNTHHFISKILPHLSSGLNLYFMLHNNNVLKKNHMPLLSNFIVSKQNQINFYVLDTIIRHFHDLEQTPKTFVFTPLYQTLAKLSLQEKRVAMITIIEKILTIFGNFESVYSFNDRFDQTILFALHIFDNNNHVAHQNKQSLNNLLPQDINEEQPIITITQQKVRQIFTLCSLVKPTILIFLIICLCSIKITKYLYYF